MHELVFDLSKTTEKLKPLNAVNNGPTAKGVRGVSNFELYCEANIPFARLHDSSFCSSYGGEFTVDVHRIFRNFDADENAPESYDFRATDKYLKTIVESGTKIFYRLGASIEHGIKCGTIPPKDNLKWAKICEHIILHYTEGWNNGFNYDIEYWEIWNEPDCKNGDGSCPTWQGTDEEFAVFFCTVAKYLKNRFPNLKIGGPAVAWIGSKNTVDAVFNMARKENVKLDFISYHLYTSSIGSFIAHVVEAKRLFTEFGYGDVELILNEWNYIKGWTSELWNYSLQTEQNLKGASFVSAVFAICQPRPVDMLMYYDARPGTGMNGIFNQWYNPLKTYFVLKTFGEMRKNNFSYVPCNTDVKNVYGLCGTDGNNSALLLTYYDDVDEAPNKDIKITFKNSVKSPVKVSYYITDSDNDLKLIREEIFSGDVFSAYLTLKLFDCYYIKIEKID